MSLKTDAIGRRRRGAYRTSLTGLTPAEAAQAELEAQKMTRKEIAARLGVSVGTVQQRSRIIREKIWGAK